MLRNFMLSSRNQILLVCVALALAVVAVYAQTHQFDFVHLDDPVYVTQNPNIQSGLSTEGVVWAFTTKYFHFWNPLVWISYMADYQLHGMHAGGFHLTHLILHLLSTLLLFGLFFRMTGKIWPSAFVAALFAVHPLHVESVAWVAERKDVLSAFFWMLSLYAYVYYTEKTSAFRYLLVALAFIGALMSKPMAVTLPVVMLLLDYWPLNRLQWRKTATVPAGNSSVCESSPKKKTEASKGKSAMKGKAAQTSKDPKSRMAGRFPVWQVYEKLPLFALSLLLTVVTIIPAEESGLKGLSDGWSLAERLAQSPVYVVLYLVKTFWPQNMAVFYPSEQFAAWQVAGAVLLVVAICVFVLLWVRSRPYLFVGWLWFAIAILPVLGVIPITFGAPYSMADRYHYLPSIGLGVMLAWGLPALIRKEDLRKKILLPAGMLIIIFWTFLAWQQCRHWQDGITLFRHTLKVTAGNYIAHNNLAIALFARGNIDASLYHHSEAIRIREDYAEAYYNRATTYASLQRYPQALDDFNQAIRLEAAYADAYNNRGSVHMALGHKQEAMADFNRVIALDNLYANAYNNRAILHFNEGRFPPGCLDAQKACSLGNCRAWEAARTNGLCF